MAQEVACITRWESGLWSDTTLKKWKGQRGSGCQGILPEIIAGRGTPDGGVWLDMSHLGAEFVERTFPGMVDRVKDIGKDLPENQLRFLQQPIFRWVEFALTGTVAVILRGFLWQVKMQVEYRANRLVVME